MPVRLQSLPRAELAQSARVLRQEGALLHRHLLRALAAQEEAIAGPRDGAGAISSSSRDSSSLAATRPSPSDMHTVQCPLHTQCSLHTQSAHCTHTLPIAHTQGLLHTHRAHCTHSALGHHPWGRPWPPGWCWGQSPAPGGTRPAWRSHTPSTKSHIASHQLPRLDTNNRITATSRQVPRTNLNGTRNSASPPAWHTRECAIHRPTCAHVGRCSSQCIPGPTASLAPEHPMIQCIPGPSASPGRVYPRSQCVPGPKPSTGPSASLSPLTYLVPAPCTDSSGSFMAWSCFAVRGRSLPWKAPCPALPPTACAGPGGNGTHAGARGRAI